MTLQAFGLIISIHLTEWCRAILPRSDESISK